MASSLVQIRIDNKLKDEVSAVYEELGLDLSTAVRIFFKRSVAEQGIPFAMKLSDKTRTRIPQEVSYALDAMAESALANGVSDMSLEEINAEISETRKES